MTLGQMCIQHDKLPLRCPSLETDGAEFLISDSYFEPLRQFTGCVTRDRGSTTEHTSPSCHKIQFGLSYPNHESARNASGLPMFIFDW
jgi:hypothetical protein